MLRVHPVSGDVLVTIELPIFLEPLAAGSSPVRPKSSSCTVGVGSQDSGLGFKGLGG